MRIPAPDADRGQTRNPNKYNKNADRNRLRAVEKERRVIWSEAIKQAQRLAAKHDPSGDIFNVGPVVVQEDGRVVSLQGLKKREARKAEEETRRNGTAPSDDAPPGPAPAPAGEATAEVSDQPVQDVGLSNVSQDRLAMLNSAPPARQLSKSQLRKRTALESQPPPRRPVLPEGIPVPEGEEDWIGMWDLLDEELERRVIRAKRRAAAERKALRKRQQAGKVERRAARDEKRTVYRDLKLTWKLIKEKERKFKTQMKGVEEAQAKKIAIDLSRYRRQRAMDCCVQLGYTLENTPGVDEITPRALGMKGHAVDFEAIQANGLLTAEDNHTNGKSGSKSKKRVDLSTVPEHATSYLAAKDDASNSSTEDEFIKLDDVNDQDNEALKFNHKTRRKLRRAIESAQIRKELLVRERAREHYVKQGLKPPPELETLARPISKRGQRLQENGTFETAKAERGRLRLELTEFNKAARVLRKQAKEISLEAGLRVYAEMTGRIPARGIGGNEGTVSRFGVGWHVPSAPNPRDFLRPEDVQLRA